MGNKENDKHQPQADPTTDPVTDSTKDPKMLTPWQKENLRYLEQTGDVPIWKESETSEVVSEATGEEDQVTPSPPEHSLDIVTMESVKDLPKSASFADKLPKMKEARQKRLKRRLTLIVSVFGTSAILLSYYVSPLSKLSQIDIVGNQVVTKEAIAAATKLTQEDFIWSAYFDKEAIPNIKKANPRIKSVEVKLRDFHNLKYIVTEYEDMAYSKKADLFHPVLENGEILAETVAVTNETLPVLINFDKDENLINLMSHFNEVDQEVKDNIKEIHQTPSDYNEFLMTIYMKDGNQIIASTKDYQTKINYYPKVKADAKVKGVVDMEAGIFFTSFDEIEKRKKTAAAQKEQETWLKTIEEEQEDEN